LVHQNDDDDSSQHKKEKYAEDGLVVDVQCCVEADASTLWYQSAVNFAKNIDVFLFRNHLADRLRVVMRKKIILLVPAYQDNSVIGNTLSLRKKNRRFWVGKCINLIHPSDNNFSIFCLFDYICIVLGLSLIVRLLN
jgi:hypothetical protein